MHTALDSSAWKTHRPFGGGPEEATKMMRGMEHLSYEERLRWQCSAWRREGSRDT